MHPLVDRLDAALAANYPALYDVLAPGSPGEDIDELEREFGMPLPEAYRSFLAWRGPNPPGTYPCSGYMIKIYELTSARNALESVQMHRDLREEPGWVQAAWWGEFYLPLMAHGGPELVIDMAGEALLDSGGGEDNPYPTQPAQVLEFHHDSEMRPIHAPSLEVWLEAFAITCERKLFGVNVNDYGSGRIVELTDENDAFEHVLKELAPGFPTDTTVLHFPDYFDM
ncbi:SMI1/KNR4 family protein [Tsukamurella sp. TY48]|uniref:SMI1/KNR4 family protein n=1 Tax=Tsukamurella TaxID=2060 RepID=UPI001C7D5333|nr:SMI1/KNR4 family protein [Tsukamurella sp. TY48]